MPDKIITYNEHIIEVTHQGNTGDNTKVFFRVLKNDETELTLWQVIAGTEYRGGNTSEIQEKLTSDGLEKIYSLLDNYKYKKGSVYTFYSSN